MCFMLPLCLPYLPSARNTYGLKHVKYVVGSKSSAYNGCEWRETIKIPFSQFKGWLKYIYISDSQNITKITDKVTNEKKYLKDFINLFQF